MNVRAVTILTAAATLAAAIAVAAVPAEVQQARGDVARSDAPQALPTSRSSDPGNAPYDGRFTFARIRFEPLEGGFSFRRRRDVKWDHDFPRAERNFAQILAELTAIRPYMQGGNVLTLDDPELFKYPVIYLCEPGFWSPNEAESVALRAYLQKGGFIIFDDFFGAHWDNFQASMRTVLPEARLVRLDRSHPIFDSFYRVESLEMASYGRDPAEFWGIYEDNDPAKRLLAVINYNNDLGENWEYSDTGTLPVDVTNQAYKLGVNYVIYAMTH